MENNFYSKLPRGITLFLGVVIFASVQVSCSEQKQFQAPLFENIGDYRMDVSTTSKDAKRFFDQGLMFTYGFNHGEAARSFREAIRLDSNFVMAYWGLSYALGPNYNAPLDPSAKDEIMWAVKKASSLKDHANDLETGFIEAIEAKYVEGIDDPQLTAFSDAMKKLSLEYPKNADVITMYAESLMLQHPWDLYEYKGGPIREWTPEIIHVLSNALKIDSDHPLANHLNIHALEASDSPELGMRSAEQLTNLIIPGAGHMVHMPSHIYINTGDYHLGTEVNLEAVRADSIYSAECEVQGAFPLYYYHNYHFLVACAALEGRGALAIESAFKMTQTIDQSLLGEPGFETTQHFMSIPYNVLVKFAQWEKILALPSPDPAYPYLKTIWHYARGMASANLNDLGAAQEELETMVKLQEGAGFEEYLIFGINPGQMVVDIAIKVLGAEIAKENNDFALAEKLLLEAVDIEDSMSYTEPPDWFFSVRHILGDNYMQREQFEAAEKVYWKDLQNFPKNGFALNGLYESLIAQGKEEEANEISQKLTQAWAYADVNLKFSRIDKNLRKDLALKVLSDSPIEIRYLAATFCGSY